MTWILAAAISAMLIELALRLPLLKTARGINEIAGRALRVVRSRSVSDHWKEKVMLSYAGSLFARTLRLAALLAVIGGAAVLLDLAAASLDTSFSPFLTSATGLSFSAAAAVSYLGLRTFLARL